MIEYLVLVLTIIFFIIASIEDIKKREVYDYINYSYSFLIIVVAIFHSLFLNSFEPIKYVGFGMLLGFALGSIIYYLGVWGGGDAKFLIGFSGASYYLMNFSNGYSKSLEAFYFMIVNLFYDFFKYFIDIFLEILLFFDFIFLIFLIYFAFKNRKKANLLNLGVLILILFSLFLGLFLSNNAYFLLFFGFLSFVFVFFANDEIFSDVYYKYKKPILNLKKGDVLDKDLKHKNDVLVKQKDTLFGGITQEAINNVFEKVEKKENRLIIIRKIIPVGQIIALNFLFYILKVLIIDIGNFSIFVFLLKFLFISFIVGGIIGLIFIIFFYVRDRKKIKIEFSKMEYILLIITSFIILGLSFINFIFSFFILVIFMMVFLKVAKKVERTAFVKKKDLDKITLGDWIVEDIKVNGKIIFEVSDFKLGVDEKQLEKIKTLAKNNPQLKHLFVKDGLAFLPPLFIGFIIVLLI